MSPKKKKMKTNGEKESLSLKRPTESDGGGLSKRSKSIKSPDEDILAKKRKNFVTACEQVSYKAYFNHRARLLLLYLPSCMKNSVCKHNDGKNVSLASVRSFFDTSTGFQDPCSKILFIKEFIRHSTNVPFPLQ